MIAEILFLILLSIFLTFLIAPTIINFLYKNHIVRLQDFAMVSSDLSKNNSGMAKKVGTPIMGGIMIIATVVVLTLTLNWNFYTKVPILLFLISALLGGIDDYLNIFGRKRIVKPFHKHLKLVRVHRKKLFRLWLFVLTPWIAYKNFWFKVGSYPGKGIHAGEKIIIQTITGIIGAMWVYGVLGIDYIWLPIIGNLFIGRWMIPLIVFIIIAITNAVNISDGLDGLSSGMLMLAFFAYLVISYSQSLFEVSKLIAVVIGALISYLYFNIKPARIQMGDVGSLALGTLLGVVAILTHRLFLLPIIGGMFVLEVASSLLQALYRAVFAKRLFKMAPLHLHFIIKGWPEEKVVMRFWLFELIFIIVGLFISFF